MRRKTTWIIPSLLAVLLLGLLWAVPTSAAPSSAVTGFISLSGGAGTARTALAAGTIFYSDQSTFNVATATVTDADFSSVRTGIVRYANVAASSTTFDIDLTATSGSTIGGGIIAGEKSQTDKFSGNASDTVFTLTKKGRDADDDGDLDDADISVKVDGVTLATTAFAHGKDSTSTHIIKVTLSAAAASGTDNVEVTYEITEYDGANTPLASASQHVALYGNGYAGATNSVIVVGAAASTGIITVNSVPAIASNDEVIITFKYNVTDSSAKLITFSSPSLGAKSLARQLAGAETSATSGVFSAKVALIEANDFVKIQTEAGDIANDATANGGDNDGIVQIDELNNTAGLGTDLKTRTEAAAAALSLTKATAAGTLLTANTTGLLVPVLDGEVLSASYVDGTTTRTDTADVDLKAPTITLTSPSHGSFGKAVTTLKVTVTDDLSAGGKASGVALGDVGDLRSDGFSGALPSAQVTSVQLASNSFEITGTISTGQIAASFEGAVKWWVPTKDKVGNIPVFSDSRTAAQNGQGVANPAVLGAGDPANPTALPGNPFKTTVDLNAPVAHTTNLPKTGGAIDTRLTAAVTGSMTSSTDSTTVLTDATGGFVAAGIAKGDLVTNISDGSKCTADSLTATTVTCAAALVSLAGTGADKKFQLTDNYTITNPALGNVKVLKTALDKMVVEFNLGTGAAKLDATTVAASDFNVCISTTTCAATGATTLVIDSATVDAAGNKVLLDLSADLGTSDKPKVEIVPDTNDGISDTSGNAIAAVSGANAIGSVDGLAPVITGPDGTGSPTITGDAASRAASNTSIDIEFSAGETAAATPTVTATYLKKASDDTLEEDSTKSKALTVTSSGVNTWKTTVLITTITGTSTAGLVNVVVNLTDAAGNVAAAGVADPDGTTAATAGVPAVKATALVFEFDNLLNGGESEQKDIFVVSPNTGTAAAATTDVANPFITANFDTGAGGSGENGEYALGTLVVDTHNKITLTSAVWTDPDGVATDVLASMVAADDNSFVYAAAGLAVGAHKLTLQATDEVGNVSTSAGATTVGSFALSLSVTARADYKVKVKPGFNLVSVPAAPSVTAINDIIGVDSPIDTVLTYENSTGLWLVAFRDEDAASATVGQLIGNLTDIDAKHAYWVNSDRFFDLKVSIPRAAAGVATFPAVIPVYGLTGPGEGWNVVPIGDPAQSAAGTDIDADDYFSGVSWSAAFAYDTASSSYIKIVPAATVGCGASGQQPCLDVGSGYFVFITKDGYIIP